MAPKKIKRTHSVRKLNIQNSRDKTHYVRTTIVKQTLVQQQCSSRDKYGQQVMEMNERNGKEREEKKGHLEKDGINCINSSRNNLYQMLGNNLYGLLGENNQINLGRIGANMRPFSSERDRNCVSKLIVSQNKQNNNRFNINHSNQPNVCNSQLNSYNFQLNSQKPNHSPNNLPKQSSRTPQLLPIINNRHKVLSYQMGQHLKQTNRAYSAKQDRYNANCFDSNNMNGNNMNSNGNNMNMNGNGNNMNMNGNNMNGNGNSMNGNGNNINNHRQLFRVKSTDSRRIRIMNQQKDIKQFDQNKGIKEVQQEKDIRRDTRGTIDTIDPRDPNTYNQPNLANNKDRPLQFLIKRSCSSRSSGSVSNRVRDGTDYVGKYQIKGQDQIVLDYREDEERKGREMIRDQKCNGQEENQHKISGEISRDHKSLICSQQLIQSNNDSINRFQTVASGKSQPSRKQYQQNWLHTHPNQQPLSNSRMKHSPQSHIPLRKYSKIKNNPIIASYKKYMGGKKGQNQICESQRKCNESQNNNKYQNYNHNNQNTANNHYENYNNHNIYNHPISIKSSKSTEKAKNIKVRNPWHDKLVKSKKEQQFNNQKNSQRNQGDLGDQKHIKQQQLSIQPNQLPLQSQQSTQQPQPQSSQQGFISPDVSVILQRTIKGHFQSFDTYQPYNTNDGSLLKGIATKRLIAQSRQILEPESLKELWKELEMATKNVGG